jgi:septal ring-binding cell division protein DamX
VPDLNLKGEEEQQTLGRKPPRRRRGIFFLSAIAGTLVVIAIAASIVVKLGLLQPQEREVTQPEPQPTFKPETISQKIGVADTLAIDSSKTQLPPANIATLPESSAVSPADTSAQLKSSGEFTIQVSAWQSGKRAAAELRHLKRLGLDVYLTQSEPDSLGRVWNRIRMGHYQTLEEAKRVAERFLDTLLVGYTFEKAN